jgi:hypothetical protein
MKNLKINDKCYITDTTRVGLGLPNGVEYTIKDILYEKVEFPIVLNAEQFGEDWVQFVRPEELIPVE